jgi:hypothetical protein
MTKSPSTYTYFLVFFFVAFFATSSSYFGFANILFYESKALAYTLPGPTVTPTPVASPTPIAIDLTQENPPVFSSSELQISEIFDISVGSSDFDCDGIDNKNDNCPLLYNSDQKDVNKNGVGDVCEGKAKNKVDRRCDADKDGILNKSDNCPLVCNPKQEDKNKNGVGDVCDPEFLSNWARIAPCSKPPKGCAKYKKSNSQVKDKPRS